MRGGDPEALITAVASGMTIVDTATIAGMSERTAQRHLSDPPTKGRMEDLRRQRVERLGNRLDELAMLALDQVEMVLREPETPAGVRVRAAIALITESRHRREVEDVARRLDDLSGLVRGQPDPFVRARELLAESATMSA